MLEKSTKSKFYLHVSLLSFMTENLHKVCHKKQIHSTIYLISPHIIQSTLSVLPKILHEVKKIKENSLFYREIFTRQTKKFSQISEKIKKYGINRIYTPPHLWWLNFLSVGQNHNIGQ